jgi:hypothetical protein
MGVPGSVIKQSFINYHSTDAPHKFSFISHRLYTVYKLTAPLNEPQTTCLLMLVCDLCRQSGFGLLVLGKPAIALPVRDKKRLRISNFIEGHNHVMSTRVSYSGGFGFTYRTIERLF